MPTVNQLVRKGRKPVRKKTKAPAMHWVQNSLPKPGQNGVLVVRSVAVCVFKCAQ
ncbi:MAG: hypothetical protein CM1200mP22_20590 [Dehalococcoidia bacterium]|nr:MAG: hypothetical protein CM1200mP22_20590 [Dehalococcoidia bacterium]